MSDYENAFNAVYMATGICKTKVISRSRLWPVQEARLLFVLLLSRRGYDDQKVAMVLERNRTTIIKSRHTAEDYIKLSSLFHDKYKKASEAYAECQVSNS